MSELKCPICGGELKHDTITGIYCCKRMFVDCPLGSGTGAFGTKELWQALTDSMKEHDLCHDALVERTKELDRTRKALDVAVDALKLMYQGNGDPQDIMRYKDNRWTSVRRLCKQTLEQITALTKG